MTGPKRIWAWPWEVNPQMGQWTVDQQIVGEGAEYVHIDEVNAIIAAADRRAEMHECAMEERDDCIEDWSKANDQICRLTSELDAMRAALKPLTVQDAARHILSDDIAISHMAQALHDGPLGADDYWFSAARPQGAWCVDAVRVVLRAIAEGK